MSWAKKTAMLCYAAVVPWANIMVPQLSNTNATNEKITEIAPKISTNLSRPVADAATQGRLEAREKQSLDWTYRGA